MLQDLYGTERDLVHDPSPGSGVVVSSACVCVDSVISKMLLFPLSHIIYDRRRLTDKRLMRMTIYFELVYHLYLVTALVQQQ